MACFRSLHGRTSLFLFSLLCNAIISCSADHGRVPSMSEGTGSTTGRRRSSSHERAPAAAHGQLHDHELYPHMILLEHGAIDTNHQPVWHNDGTASILLARSELYSQSFARGKAATTGTASVEHQFLVHFHGAGTRFMIFSVGVVCV